MSMFTKRRLQRIKSRPDYKPSPMPSKEELHRMRVAYEEHKENSKPGRNQPELWSTGLTDPDPEFDTRYQEQIKAEEEFKQWKKEHQYPNFIPKSWTECYKMPLHIDEYSMAYIWTADNQMAASTLDIDYRDPAQFQVDLKWWKKIVAVINGEDTPDWGPHWSVSKKDPCAIFFKDEFKFLVRGWGHLTGSGWAFKLPPELASEIQDQFVQYILDKLNGK